MAELTPSTTIACLLMYHPDDRRSAIQLKTTLEEEGITCHLLFDVVGADIHTDMFRCAKDADCVISLITQTLFGDEKCRIFHAKVYSYLKGKKYIAVKMSIEDNVYNSPAGGFLEGCHVLAPETMTGVEFRERLVSEIKAVVHRISIKPLSDNDPSSISDIQIGVNRESVNIASQLDHGIINLLYELPDYGIKSNLLKYLTSLKGITTAADANLFGDITKSLLDEERINNKYVHQSLFSNMKVTNDAHVSETESNPKYLPILEVGKNQIAVSKQQSHCLSHGSFGTLPKLSGKPICTKITGVLKKPLNQFLRSPFLLPILNIEEQPLQGTCRISTVFMNGGNLGELLRSETKKLGLRLTLLRITFQVSEAICFFHDRNVFHGNIIPSNILIDEHNNARLGYYGVKCEPLEVGLQSHFDSPRSVRRCTAEDEDIFMFGTTLRQILKCTDNRKFVEEHTDLPEAAVMATDQNHVEGKVWQFGHEATIQLCKILQHCYRTAHTVSMHQVAADLKDLITSQEIPLATFPCDSCVHCTIEMLRQGLQARSSNCPEKCMFLNICPSCMPSLCSSRLRCPLHDTQIFPPFGGTNSCALIITGRDQNQNTNTLQNIDTPDQDAFYKDAHEMALCITHPHIMAIPWENIYRVSPWENCTSAEIDHIVQLITRKKPDFFLLYYSGHKAAEASFLDVSGRQGDALNVADLRSSLLQPLVNACSRMLLILDCCFAASLSQLLHQELYTDDRHVIFHTILSSCGRNESSNIQANESQSLFTKCLVSGLKGGRKCPNDIQSCPDCQIFRKEIDENQSCVSKKILQKFVNLHMKSTFQEGRDDHQGPFVVEARRDSDPVIAYFRNQALYRFHFVPPKGQNFTTRICEFDSLEYDVDEVLQHIWNQLKDQCLPKHLDYLTLRIFCRKADDSVHEITEFSDIVTAVYEDAESLYVSIRTDGEHLGDKKWVVCFCDKSQTKDAVKDFMLCRGNRRQTKERNVTKIAVSEMSPTWNPADDNEFNTTLQKCWNSFSSLKRKDSFLQIEIYEKLSMFYIVATE